MMHSLITIKHVPKGWGYEKWIANSPEYCGKLLFIKKTKRCSWHYHKLKDETFYITEGRFQLDWVDTKDASTKTVFLESNDTWRIPPMVPHQVTCISHGGTIIEVSTHDDPEDNDNFRIGKGDNQ